LEPVVLQLLVVQIVFFQQLHRLVVAVVVQHRVRLHQQQAGQVVALVKQQIQQARQVQLTKALQAVMEAVAQEVLAAAAAQVQQAGTGLIVLTAVRAVMAWRLRYQAVQQLMVVVVVADVIHQVQAAQAVAAQAQVQ